MFKRRMIYEFEDQKNDLSTPKSHPETTRMSQQQSINFSDIQSAEQFKWFQVQRFTIAIKQVPLPRYDSYPKQDLRSCSLKEADLSTMETEQFDLIWPQDPRYDECLRQILAAKEVYRYRFPSVCSAILELHRQTKNAQRRSTNKSKAKIPTMNPFGINIEVKRQQLRMRKIQ